MNNIDTRVPFFPNSKTGQQELQRIKQTKLTPRNSYERSQELQNTTAKDAQVTIPSKVKDFSRIKKAVDMAPEVDNSARIAELKAQIQAGTYQPDYDAIAEKILTSEF